MTGDGGSMPRRKRKSLALAGRRLALQVLVRSLSDLREFPEAHPMADHLGSLRAMGDGDWETGIWDRMDLSWGPNVIATGGARLSCDLC